MCIYTLKKTKLKILQGGCATPPNVPKLGVSGVKGTATRCTRGDASSFFLYLQNVFVCIKRNFL